MTLTRNYHTLSADLRALRRHYPKEKKKGLTAQSKVHRQSAGLSDEETHSN